MMDDRCNYSSFWAIFCSFSNLTARKIKIKKKVKKTPEEIIILYKCNKNHHHMVYCSLDMVRDRCNCYLSFWAIFCPFTPLKAKKNQDFYKMKKNTIIIIYCEAALNYV